MKSEARALAEKFGLPNAQRKDSQGLCFVGKVDLASVLGRFLALEPGPILAKDGAKLGTHKGLEAYTIGQRAGLGIGGTGPYFVAQKVLAQNALVAVKRDDPLLYTSEATIDQLTWVADVPAEGARVGVKLRYRQPDAEAEFVSEGAHASLRFMKPQRGVAPGQAAVCYQGDELLGGGIIESAV
jgi:tRNA-specific 2-thiouridylase